MYLAKPPIVPVVVLHQLHFPVFGRGLELQRLYFSTGNVVERLNGILKNKTTFVGHRGNVVK